MAASKARHGNPIKEDVRSEGPLSIEVPAFHLLMVVCRRSSRVN